VAAGITLYRYRNLAGDGFRFAQDIFLRNRLFWPFHSQLNDPAEGIYRDSVRLVQSSDGRWYAPAAPLKRPDMDVRVLSFSEDPKHPLMWSHYANAHRGICIGFRRDFFTGVLRVRYPQRIPRLDLGWPVEKKRTVAFLTKRETWAYEREWRLVDSDNRFSEQPHVTLEPNTITQVIFGERTLQDDREWVFEWLRLSKCRASTQRVRFSGVRARLHVEKFTERDKW
jgi:hypothetical protein